MYRSVSRLLTRLFVVRSHMCMKSTLLAVFVVTVGCQYLAGGQYGSIGHVFGPAYRGKVDEVEELNDERCRSSLRDASRTPDVVLMQYNCRLRKARLLILSNHVREALDEAKRALSLAKQGIHRGTDIEFATKGMAHLLVAHLRALLNEWSAARDSYRAAVSSFQAVAEPENQETLRDNHINASIFLAQIEGWRGDVLRAVGRVEQLRRRYPDLDLVKQGRNNSMMFVLAVVDPFLSARESHPKRTLLRFSGLGRGINASDWGELLQVRMYREEGDWETAEKIVESLYRRDSINDSRLRLAIHAERAAISLERGDVSEASHVLLSVLRKQVELFGMMHPDTLTTRVLFGRSKIYRGRYQEARQVLNAAYADILSSFGERSPLLLAVLFELISVDWPGNTALTSEHVAHIVSVERHLLSFRPFAAYGGNVIWKKNRLKRAISHALDIYFSEIQRKRSSTKDRLLLSDIVLSGKSLATRALAAGYEGLRGEQRRRRRLVRARHQAVKEVRANIADAHSIMSNLWEEERKLLSILERRQEENNMAGVSRSKTGYNQMREATKEIMRTLRVGDVLMNYIQYSARNGSIRYAVCLIRQDGIEWFDLGHASAIDQAIQNFLRAMIRRSAEYESAGKEVFDAVIEPLLDRLTPGRGIFVSADGVMNKLPFQALEHDDKYLLEEYAFHYLGSGLELLQDQAQPRGRVMVLANPTGSGLPGATEEAKVIRRLFGDVQVFADRKARAAALFDESSPWILHIATHSTTDRTGLGNLMYVAESAEAGVDSSLLSSHLQMAPDSSLFQQHWDVLSAYEVAALDLSQTALVVLSGCQTGSGVVAVGEGMMGFRTALRLAGAKTQLLSLWQIPDLETSRLMNDFYQNLSLGMPLVESLREAQLSMIGDERTRAPYYWAGFTLYGNWRAIVN